MASTEPEARRDARDRASDGAWRGAGAGGEILPAAKSALVYFLVVFAAGFALGVCRELWAVPQFGARVAELIEAPIMLAVVCFAACWVIARFGVSPAAPARIAMGLGALALLLAAEFSLVLAVRGLTFEQYIAGRDPVSGAVYVMLLAAYALMPLLVLRR